jgi:ABC-type antimicrobial peptide transport system permease subunit
MDLTAQTITLGSIIAIVGLVIGVLNFIANRRKGDKEAEARLVKIEAMLVNIDKNTSNLNAKVESHDKWLTRHESRISVLETKKGK